MRISRRTRAGVGILVVGALVVAAAAALVLGSRGGDPTATVGDDSRIHVVLGDSYSSGDGTPSSDDVSSGQCLRSDKAWADRLRELTGVDLKTVNLACPGATQAALTSSYLEQEPQLSAMATADPALVTVTIGGNDVGFVPGMIDCYRQDCVADGTLETGQSRIATVGRAAAADYTAIRDAAPTGAVVAVVGYPDLFGSAAAVGCPWLSLAEQQAVRDLQHELDRQLAAAATSAGVRYVSLSSALAGHEMCTAEPWLNPVTGGEGTPAHPNTAGQLAMAEGVQAGLADILPS